MNLVTEKYKEEKDMSSFSFDTTDWKEIKKNLYYRFVNENVLSQYGDNIPYIKYMDLAKTVTIREKINDVIHSHFITEEDIKRYNVSWEQVVACTNVSERTKKDGRIDLLSNFLLRHTSSMFPLVSVPKGAVLGIGEKDFVVDQDSSGNPNILISYSRKFGFGAAYGFSNDALKKAYYKFGRENFYIVPMSIHNLLFIKESYVSKNGEKPMADIEEDLSDMIAAVNDDIDSWKNILSYNIYKFLADEGGRLMIVTK